MKTKQLGLIIALARTLPLAGARAISFTNFSFSFQTASHLSCAVAYNDDLRVSNWQFLETMTGNGSLKQSVMPMTNGPQRFFRIAQ